MKVFIITDLEGVSGILNFDDYATSSGRYYELGKGLVTGETNAAIEGALAAGADEVHVLDGHGWGGISVLELHPEAKLIAGHPLRYPFGMDQSFDAMLIIGQHAKAGAPGGHLSHTGNFEVKEYTVNGVSLGEMGINMLVGAYFGVPTVMVSGDRAGCDEALALVPDMEAAPVKEGISWGAAVHLHHEKARALIRDKARCGLERLEQISPFKIPPPYERIIEYYGTKDKPTRVTRNSSHDLIELLNAQGG